MRFRSLLIAACLSALLAGCGSDNEQLIPQGDADRISGLVAEAGDASSARGVRERPARRQRGRAEPPGLPRKTAKDLKANLRDWLEYLDGQIADSCEAEPEKTATPTPTATETATPEPTETATPTPTETATPSPTASPEPTVTVDPGTGGETGPEEPSGSGGVPPGEDG